MVRKWCDGMVDWGKSFLEIGLFSRGTLRKDCLLAKAENESKFESKEEKSLIGLSISKSLF